MRRLVLASLAMGAALLVMPTAASAQRTAAQTPAVSEEEARCFIDGICKIEEEKRFSIARINSKGKQDRPAVAEPAARPRASAAARPRQRLASVARAGTSSRASNRAALDMRMTFNLNSAQLTPQARSQADVFAKVMRESSTGGTFLIEGHTDSIGTREANLDLSRRRANSVISYLVEQGVPQSRLRAVGFGFDRPREGLPASHPSNRRVEIVKE